MKNRIKTQKISPVNVNHIQENSILRKNKSPLAIFIATALFVFGSAHAIAAPGDKPTYDQTIGTDEEYARLEITGDQRVDNMVIHHGTLHISGKAKAYSTTVHDKSELFLSGHMPSAFDTQIESGGSLFLSTGATADNTIVKPGGKISIGTQSSMLSNSTIEGILTLSGSVQLEGRTYFLPGSKLEIEANDNDDDDDDDDDEFDLINNGEIIFSNSMKIAAGIKGDGKITIQKDPSGINPDNTELILIGRNINDPDDADYDYSGDTFLMDGSTLQIKEATFHNSPIRSNAPNPEATELWIGETGSDNKSYLRTVIQGGTNVSILNNSQWDMTGASSIHNLNLSSRGIVNLSHNNKPGNILTIHGNYNADNQSLLEFNTQLGDDDSPTDRMMVSGNTSGKTNVKVNNIDGAGDKTDVGILLIQVFGNSDGEFIQSSRIKAGAFEYKLGRGEDNLHKNWYLHSKLADYVVDNNKPTDTNTIAQTSNADADKTDPVNLDKENDAKLDNAAVPAVPAAPAAAPAAPADSSTSSTSSTSSSTSSSSTSNSTTSSSTSTSTSNIITKPATSLCP